MAIQIWIETSEATALATFVAARQPAGPLINGFLTRLQTAYQGTVKEASRALFASGLDGTIYQNQVDAALAAGVTQAQITKIVAATTGVITP
jgi:hypothetical protein